MEKDLLEDGNSSNKKRTIHIILIAVIVLVVLAIILGLVFGLRKKSKNSGDEDDVEIVNSYTNTEELMKKYPLENPITILGVLEENIQNRLLTGFENWNRGYKAWKKWGNILYTNASIYNVNGARLTLAQYQSAMDVTLKRTNVILGDFHNMIINGNYTAIFYDDYHVVGEEKEKGTVMEFVLFKDYGGELGTRVVVGWGGTKGNSFNFMRSFQEEDQKMVQDEKIKLILNYKIPSSTNLHEKYPILYPVEYLDTTTANKFIEIILEGFDKWNTGIEEYINWLSTGYTDDALSYGLEGEKRTMEEYKTAMQTLVKTKTIEKLYFYNILIRDKWAAIHYAYRIEEESGTKDEGDRMQFLQFKKVEENSFKIVASWIK